MASGIIDTTQQALSVIANGDLAEEEKEERVRGASLKLLTDFFRIAAIGIVALSVPAGLLLGGAALNLYALDHAVNIAVSWPFLIGSTVGAIALWLALDRLRKADTQPENAQKDVPYSPLDKALHDFAFASPTRQIRLGGLENRLYRRRINLDHAARPIFITSLPRAGTTIMLEALADVPELASATYQHMPFTLSPLMWGKFSSTFWKAREKTERAHGDGIDVDMNSPEAFEEMLWMAFWSDRYQSGQIAPWTPEDRNAEFETFFRTHMAKIVATKPAATRYVSKNNANIARLGLIEKIFPDATTLIPIRNPRAQVKSLFRQHLRFAELQDREPFARRYMEGIGHFEFGEALRPISFDPARSYSVQPEQMTFWLHYWIEAYEHVLANAGAQSVFVDHDALCRQPLQLLPELADAIGLEHQETLTEMAGMFHAPRPVPELNDVPTTLLQRADELHAELCRHTIGFAAASKTEI
ncbi:sulfotransferase [Gymnodinialimonas mytili]|uniref:sulfotransferase n=1 Tax=Gymnodinialimonas mytili TaxID=3126503 RepID=UPI0030EE7D59